MRGTDPSGSALASDPFQGVGLPQHRLRNPLRQQTEAGRRGRQEGFRLRFIFDLFGFIVLLVFIGFGIVILGFILFIELGFVFIGLRIVIEEQRLV